MATEGTFQQRDSLEAFSYALRALTRDNVETIFRYAESYIERLFLGTLVLSFLKSDPLGLQLTPPLRNAPKSIEDRRGDLAAAKSWWRLFRSEWPEASAGEFPSWLADVRLKVGSPMPFAEDLVSSVVLSNRGFCRSFYVTLQAGFPDMRINGRSLRTDLLVWILDDERVRVVVECDGFRFHRKKASFTADRQRDRLFQSRGYQVLRFGGQEIIKRPIDLSYELFEFLQNRYCANAL